MKRNVDDFYLNQITEELLFFENVNQTKNFLKSKNLDPNTNTTGKNIFDTITGITRGDGYTYLLTRFYLNDNVPIERLKNLHDYIKQNKTILTKLPKPILSYETYEELYQDIIDFEGNRFLKKLINELPLNLRKQYETLNDDEKNIIKNAADDYYSKLTKDHRRYFMDSISGYKDIGVVINNLVGYIHAVVSGQDYFSIKKKIENTPDTEIVYDDLNKKILIAHIKTFESSTILGCTTKWCISRDKEHWNSYRRGGKNIFFIWDFNYTPNNDYYLVGVAYYRKKPEHSATHVKGNDKVSLGAILKSKGLTYDIFDNYIDELIKSKLNVNDIDLMDALMNYDDNPDLLINVISNSNIINSFNTSDGVSYDDDVVYLGLSDTEMADMLEIDYDGFNYIYAISNGRYYYEVDDDELNYMYNRLDNDTIALVKKLLKKIGVSDEMIGNISEEGVLKNLFEKMGWGEMFDEYIYYINDAINVAMREKALRILNEIPFDIVNGSFIVGNMISYMEKHHITAHNFDELIDEIKNNLPEISYEALNDVIYDNNVLDLRYLNGYVLDFVGDIIQNNEYWLQNKLIDIIKVLHKWGFEVLIGKNYAVKEYKNMKIIVNDIDVDENINDTIVTATLYYNEHYYHNILGKPKPQNRKIKVPLNKLRNYIQQLEIPFDMNETKSKSRKIIHDVLFELIKENFLLKSG